jgi:hypothetical protein
LFEEFKTMKEIGEHENIIKVIGYSDLADE